MDEPEEWLYFVHGTTTAVWQGEAIDPSRGRGDFGAGFYVFEDTSWGRQAVSAWARRKSRDDGGSPLLVRVRVSRLAFEALDRQDVPGDQIDTFRRRLSRFGLSGKELTVGPVGRRGPHGGERRTTACLYNTSLRGPASRN